MEPIAYSLRFAPASGNGSCLALACPAPRGSPNQSVLKWTSLPCAPTIVEWEVESMVLASTTEVIPLAVDAHGVLHVGNTRVTLDTVLAAFADGATAEE